MYKVNTLKYIIAVTIQLVNSILAGQFRAGMDLD